MSSKQAMLYTKRTVIMQFPVWAPATATTVPCSLPANGCSEHSLVATFSYHTCSTQVDEHAMYASCIQHHKQHPNRQPEPAPAHIPAPSCRHAPAAALACHLCRTYMLSVVRFVRCSRGVAAGQSGTWSACRPPGNSSLACTQ